MSSSRNDRQEGSARDVERRTGIDFDLNCPPPYEFIDPTGPHEEAAQNYNHYQGQAMDNHDIVDDDIAIISRRKFAEARKKFRRITNESSCGLAVSIGNTEVYGALSDITSRPPLTICSPRTISDSISIIQDQTIHSLDLSLSCETSKYKLSRTVATIDTHIPSAPAAVPRFQCAICIGPLVDEATTKCGHIFCNSCIETAIATQHKCPQCRRKLRKRDFFRIYLPFSH